MPGGCTCVTGEERCPLCGGRGTRDGDGVNLCVACAGKRVVKVRYTSLSCPVHGMKRKENPKTVG